jgi:hypothetical protein
MDTTLLSSTPEKISDQEVSIFHAHAAAAVFHALVGLEDLSDEKAAAYLSAHPRLFVDISYLPNAFTVEMISEARKHSGDEQVASILKENYGYRV